jgi:hypothetical protein
MQLIGHNQLVRLLALALSLTLALMLGASGAAENQAMAASFALGAPSCSDSASRQLVDSFISGFNRGDTAELDRLFSPDVFEWYSTDAPGARVGQQASDRAGLMAYFAERHREHEQLQLESFQFNGESAGGLGAVGNFEFELTTNGRWARADLVWRKRGHCLLEQPSHDPQMEHGP